MLYQNNISIASYNCNSAKNQVDVIRDIINDHDITFLQETFLSSANANFIAGLCKNINFCISDCTYNSSCERGRPKGGLVIIWKNNLDKLISPILFHDNYLGIRLKSGDNSHVLINTYLPYDDNSAIQMSKYREILASLSRDVNSHEGSIISIVGDLNADPRPTRFWHEIIDFCSEFHMNVADLELGSDLFTFLSPAHDSTRWLDHIITTRADLIYNIDILHHICIFDHFPLRFGLKFEVSTIEEEQGNETLDFTNWKNFNFFSTGNS